MVTRTHDSDFGTSALVLPPEPKHIKQLDPVEDAWAVGGGTTTFHQQITGVNLTAGDEEVFGIDISIEIRLRIAHEEHVAVAGLPLVPKATQR